VRTDHAALQWLRKTPEPVGQQARWIGFLEEFDFDVVHRPRRQHINADALSRIPYRSDEDSCRTVVQASQHVEGRVDSGLWLDEQAPKNHAVGQDEVHAVSVEPPTVAIPGAHNLGIEANTEVGSINILD